MGLKFIVDNLRVMAPSAYRTFCFYLHKTADWIQIAKRLATAVCVFVVTTLSFWCSSVSLLSDAQHKRSGEENSDGISNGDRSRITFVCACTQQFVRDSFVLMSALEMCPVFEFEVNRSVFSSFSLDVRKRISLQTLHLYLSLFAIFLLLSSIFLWASLFIYLFI